jgi:uncharacterized protein involved in exopolysaccharide biosynthesis
MDTLHNRESLDLDASQYLRVAKHHWVPAVVAFISTVAIAAVVAHLQAPSYKAQAKLLFKIDRTPALTGLGEGAGGLDPIVKSQNPLTTEVEVISSKPLLQKVIDNLNLTNERGKSLSPANLGRTLDIQILGGADVLQIAYESNDPEEAAAVVNELAHVYIENNALANRAETSEARELVATQLPQAEEFVRKSESALRQFKEENQVIALDEEAKSVVAVTQNLDSQILATQAELDEAAARSNQLRSQLGLSAQEAMMVSDLSQSSAVQGVMQELQGVRRQLAIERSFYTDESPLVIQYQAREDSLRELLQGEIETIAGREGRVPERFLQVGQQRQALITGLLELEIQRLGLARRAESLYNSRMLYKNRAETLPRLEQRQGELDRQLQVARLTYQTLLQRLQELQVAEDQASGNASVLEPASVPQNPSSTKTNIILSLGVLLGALFAVTLVFLLEMNDLKIKKQAI